MDNFIVYQIPISCIFLGHIDIQKNPLLIISLTMTATEVCLDPSEEIVFEQIDQLIELWEECLFETKRYLSNQIFWNYTQ